MTVVECTTLIIIVSPGVGVHDIAAPVAILVAVGIDGEVAVVKF